MADPPSFFATCPKGMEPLVAAELRALGAEDAKETRGGAAFSGTLETAYRACLWLRTASRVLLPVARFSAPSPEALYDGAHRIPWADHMAPDGTLAVDLAASASGITHSRYGALKVKDAIVDAFRATAGVRPSVDTERPDLRVNVHLHADVATVAVDLSGQPLHRRGYRGPAREAPLKENLAAAVLLHARWPAIAGEGGALVDLMCGAGTLVVEAAFMAADIAPGLGREEWGFSRWRGHDLGLWERLLAEARERRDKGLQTLPDVRGCDRDPRAVAAARECVERAGLAGRVRILRRALSDWAPEGGAGLVVANPPYGERLGAGSDLEGLYAELGRQLKRCFPGWRAAVLTGNPDLARHLGLRADRKHALFNGPIPCRLLHFDIAPVGSLPPRKGRPRPAL